MRCGEDLGGTDEVDVVLGEVGLALGFVPFEVHGGVAAFVATFWGGVKVLLGCGWVGGVGGRWLLRFGWLGAPPLRLPPQAAKGCTDRPNRLTGSAWL